MSDSLGPGNRNPLPENDTPLDKSGSSSGSYHEKRGNPEEGLRPADESFARAGPITPERAHGDHLDAEGASDDEAVGNPPLELSNKEEPWNRLTGDTVIAKTQTPD